tara:strand:- start:6259 stop:7173 length:915 start_codon:yes stop_codon:yes gene_type:complete
MAYNPYAIADTLSQLEQSQMKTSQQERESKIKTFEQKGKMEEQYLEDIRAAERKAQAELAKRQKKKKRRGWLKSIISIINPIAGAVIGGVDAARQQKKSAKHMLDRAQAAKKYAKDIDPRWSKTFLGKGEGGSKDYLSKAEDYYGGLVTQAQDAKPKFGDLFTTALGTGLTSYASGKAMEGFGDLFKKDFAGVEGLSGEQAQLIKDIQPSFLDSLTMGKGVERGKFLEKMKEGFPELADLSEKDLLSMLQNPDFNPLEFEGFFDKLGPFLKKSGTRFASQNPFGKGDVGEALKGILGLFSQFGR